jgi:haloalkane dehalogenase
VIALDFNGFGKSDKFTSQDDYSHALHRATLLQFCDKLELTNLTMVVQDWGGITGLSCVRDMPDRIDQMVIMNTGLPTGVDIYNFVYALPFLIWRSIVGILGPYLPVKMFFAAALNRSDKLEGYSAPFPSSAYKSGLAKWPLLIPLHHKQPVAQDITEARKYLETWDKPTLIAFADQDTITKGANEDLYALIPGARLYPEVVIKGAGHFLQDTHGSVICSEIIKFLKKVGKPIAAGPKEDPARSISGDFFNIPSFFTPAPAPANETKEAIKDKAV